MKNYIENIFAILICINFANLLGTNNSITFPYSNDITITLFIGLFIVHFLIKDKDVKNTAR